MDPRDVHQLLRLHIAGTARGNAKHAICLESYCCLLMGEEGTYRAVCDSLGVSYNTGRHWTYQWRKRIRADAARELDLGGQDILSLIKRPDNL